jgi:hypothetical protein
MKTLEIKQNKRARALTMKVEAEMRKLPNALVGDSPEYLAVCPLKHTFVPGNYVREIFLPKGMLFVTKIHKITHPFFILTGDVSVLTEEGVVRIKGPFQGITREGTKRIIFVHENTVWITVHSTDSTDLKEIEEQVIAKNFDEIDKIIEVDHHIKEAIC